MVTNTIQARRDDGLCVLCGDPAARTPNLPGAAALRSRSTGKHINRYLFFPHCPPCAEKVNGPAQHKAEAKTRRKAYQREYMSNKRAGEDLHETARRQKHLRQTVSALRAQRRRAGRCIECGDEHPCKPKRIKGTNEFELVPALRCQRCRESQSAGKRLGTAAP